MGTLKVVAKIRWDTPVEGRNVFYFHGNDALMSNKQAIADGLRSAYARMTADIANNVQLYACDFYDLALPEEPGMEQTFTSGVLTGTNGGELLPQQVALLVSFRAQANKPNRARKYLGGFSEGNLVDGVWYSTLLTHAGQFATDMLGFSALTSLDCDFATYGAQTGTPPTYVLRTLDTYKVSAIPVVQRRRRPGVGI